MNKLLGCLLTLILLFNPYSIKAEESSEETSSEISRDTWLVAIGIVAAGGFAYLGNKLGSKAVKKKGTKK